MSKIAEQIQKLKEQEKRLERENRKIAFMTHILDSSRAYEHSDFKDVKDEVVALLDNFVKKTVEAIEAGTEITITVGPPVVTAPTINVALQTPKAPEQPQIQAPAQLKPKNQVEDMMSPNEKLNFALDNRHLAGKKVSVINDHNIDIKGTVAGLDAPFVLVKTETGPTIKVPLDKVVVA